jgi:hypothetical protein
MIGIGNAIRRPNGKQDTATGMAATGSNPIGRLFPSALIQPCYVTIRGFKYSYTASTFQTKFAQPALDFLWPRPEFSKRHNRL